MRQLIWKEWHEQGWKLGFCCLLLAMMAWIGLRAQIMPDELMVMWVCAAGFLALPVLASIGLVPAERDNGSLSALLALPTGTGQLLWPKTILGVLQSFIPLVVAGAITYGLAAGREISGSEILAIFSRSCIAAIALFFWMHAMTIRLPGEARAAMLALGIVVFWLMASVGLNLWQLPQIVRAISPFALVYQLSNERVKPVPIGVGIPVQLFLSAVLWFWAKRQMSPQHGS